MNNNTGEDNFNYVIPSNVTLYEASWAHYGRAYRDSVVYPDNSHLFIDEEQVNYLRGNGNLVKSELLQDSSHLVPDKSHKVMVKFEPTSTKYTVFTGVAITFIYH
jgi:hypothetical protein